MANDDEKTDIEWVEGVARNIALEVGKVLVGKKELVHKTLVSFFSGGHALIEGVPGLAKTYFAKAFAASIGGSFKRLQFLPDLLPSDVVGINLYNPKEGDFRFRQGPIFANIILADEINRATPKTQSALLEAMEEIQVTVEGTTYPLPMPFMVLATQNPIELEGTFPLPEAQIDRFFYKISIDYPNQKEEEEILNRKNGGVEISSIQKVARPEDIMRIRQYIDRVVHVNPSLMEYISRLVAQTRRDPRVLLGASPRGSITILRASKTTAVLKGRDYVLPEDVQEVIVDSLNHRIRIKPDCELDGVTAKSVILEILKNSWVPK
jgi:MoxR-like ATPase